MTGIGSSELIILVLIGLIVLGPKRLPQIANQIGSWVGQARRMSRAMKRQLEDELDFDEDFNFKPPKIAPPPIKSAGDPAGPDYELDEVAAIEEHVPSEDDTFSPLHSEAGKDDVVEDDADSAADKDA